MAAVILPPDKLRKLRCEQKGFCLAEGGSMVVGMGAVATLDQIAPKLFDTLAKKIGKNIVEPYLLDFMEKWFDKVCKLEECKADMTVSREKRAEEKSRMLMTFVGSGIAAIATKLAVRRWWNKKHDIGEKHMGLIEAVTTGEFVKYLKDKIPDEEERRILAADEGAHFGSLALMNTGLAKATDHLIQSTTRGLECMGISKEKAHQFSSYLYVWEIPNLLGLASGLGMIGVNHKMKHVGAGSMKDYFLGKYPGAGENPTLAV